MNHRGWLFLHFLPVEYQPAEILVIIRKLTFLQKALNVALRYTSRETVCPLSLMSFYTEYFCSSERSLPGVPVLKGGHSRAGQRSTAGTRGVTQVTCMRWAAARLCVWQNWRSSRVTFNSFGIKSELMHWWMGIGSVVTALSDKKGGVTHTLKTKFTYIKPVLYPLLHVSGGENHPC